MRRISNGLERINGTTNEFQCERSTLGQLIILPSLRNLISIQTSEKEPGWERGSAFRDGEAYGESG